ncbi:MAG TPA: hypothetical protein VGJ20_39475 [Xanthobacteraceae bacterium]
MTERRFTVKRAWSRLPVRGACTGWVVFDRERPITIAFEDYAEALRHRDNIHALYLRFGW